MKNVTARRKQLAEEKRKLEAELGSIGRVSTGNTADWEPVLADAPQEPDVLDAAEHIEEFEERTAILHDLEIRYHEVVDALARIEGGTYGTCAVCGKAVEEERLQADPAARTCVLHIA